MSVAMILLPLFAYAALLFTLAFRLPPPGGPGEAPAEMRELPAALLFATLTVLALFTRKADIVFLGLGWIFVVTRIFGTWGSPGAGRARRTVDVLGLGVLALMWALFALAILLNI